MSDTALKAPQGETLPLDPKELDALSQRLRGELCLPGDTGYEEARSLWNAMIDRRPAMVVRCRGAADVMAAVDFARDHGLLLSVRGGGHNIAGKACCDAGLMIDLGPMKSVHVDPKARTAQVEPGALLADLDREAQAFGLATPLGINSTTGVAGLALGGGFGWTSRKHGLTVDNLLSADVVTADGKLLRASETENPDLFWALRGGGGNFGVVTRFEFRLHAVGPEVLSGLIVHPFEDAAALFPQYLDYVRDLPDELTCWVVLRQAPPLPFLPEQWHGRNVMILAACHVGDMDEGERLLAPLRAMGKPIADVISPHRFVDWQAAFDPLLTTGARNYWKSHDFTTLDDAAVATILDHAGRLPTPECEIFFAGLGGAVNRVAADATAYPHRDTQFVLNVHTRWRDAADDGKCVGWAREFFERTAPFANGGVYVNFMADDEANRVGGAYAGNLQRLAAIKARFDPGNLFRVNQNIAPAA